MKHNFWEAIKHTLVLYGYYEVNCLHNILTKYNINYSIAFGTLLGLIRDKSFTDNDNDLDIMVSIRDMDNIKSVLQKEGYFLLEDIYIDDKKVKGSKFLSSNGVLIDIMYYYKDDANNIECFGFLPKVGFMAGSWEDDNAEYTYITYDDSYEKSGFVEYQISDNISTKIFKEYEKHLYNYYGDTWNKKDKEFYYKDSFLKVPGIKSLKDGIKKHKYIIYHQDFNGLITEKLKNSFDMDKISFGNFNLVNVQKSFLSIIYFFNFNIFSGIKNDISVVTHIVDQCALNISNMNKEIEKQANHITNIKESIEKDIKKINKKFLSNKIRKLLRKLLRIK
jgi:hypothetical protein